MEKAVIKADICSFLQRHTLGVISTVHLDIRGPESAVVAFTETDNLEIIFGTSNTSRKYKNIQANNTVAFVIGWDSATGTVQYEGVAREISKDESHEYAALHVKKNPGSQQYVDREDQRYFVVSPTWIRFVDNAGTPPDIYEITF